MKSSKPVGKHQFALYQFLSRCNGWTSYKNDRQTVSAVSGLIRRRLAVANSISQVRLIVHYSEVTA